MSLHNLHQEDSSVLYCYTSHVPRCRGYTEPAMDDEESSESAVSPNAPRLIPAHLKSTSLYEWRKLLQEPFNKDQNWGPQEHVNYHTEIMLWMQVIHCQHKYNKKHWFRDMMHQEPALGAALA
eukprot:gene3176-3169_t